VKKIERTEKNHYHEYLSSFLNDNRIYRIIKKQMKVQKNEQKVVANKFIVGPCIGNGSFGEVFVVNVVDSLQIFALKKVCT
jgi:hypothetical protein